MDFKAYHQKQLAELPPKLEAGTMLKEITKIEAYTYQNGGQTVNAMKVFADGKEFRTTSKVLMDTLADYFKENKEPLTNVRVKQPSGKRYLTLEPTN